jgi:DNA-binding NtrC family response regulator
VETVIERPSMEVPAGESVRTRGGEIIVLSRDPESRVLLQKALLAQGLSIVTSSESFEARQALEESSAAALLVAIEGADSIDTIRSLAATARGLPVFAWSRAATPELVRSVIQAGAEEFYFGMSEARVLARRLKDRLDSEEMGATSPSCGARRAAPNDSVSRAKPLAAAESRNATPADDGVVEIISANPGMARVLDVSRRVAPTDSTVLVQGESGTGKELVARWIHRHSDRAEFAFVDVNCGALPENLLESQLFGHEKGSFTGAVQRQIGLFEIASGGTIFLDEIGELGLDMQVKLLRVLQSREFRRIGGSQVVKVDVRVIAATNRDLRTEVDQGRFRTDLFYRLNVITLEIPPLRERREDIPALLESFRTRFEVEKGLPRRRISDDAIELLQSFAWEGNVRELENAAERLLLLSRGDVITADDVREQLVGPRIATPVAEEVGYPTMLSLDEVKRLHIARVLRANSGNKMRSARVLDINVKTLYNLLKSLNVPGT